MHRRPVERGLIRGLDLKPLKNIGISIKWLKNRLIFVDRYNTFCSAPTQYGSLCFISRTVREDKQAYGNGYSQDELN